MAKLGLTTTPNYPDFPLHLQDALFPDQARPMMADADLIGQTIRYRDIVTGYVRLGECTVDDMGTSKMRGKWYMITEKDGDEDYMITAKEMKDILATRML